MKKIGFIFIFLLICIYLISAVYPRVYALSKYGSTGNEVKQIQTKLKNWGYYTGNIDGIFGSKTLSAVKTFQKKNGLVADGIVGPKTLSALGITSTTTNNLPSSTSSNTSDTNLLAKVVYAEARGEPYSGQVAIAAVVLNRVSHSSFPNTISSVVYQYQAFTCVSDGQINLTPDSTAKKAAQDAINGWDPTYGCIYYFNPKTATSKWIWSRPQVTKIGNHIFCK